MQLRHVVSCMPYNVICQEQRTRRTLDKRDTGRRSGTVRGLLGCLAYRSHNIRYT